MSPPGPAGGRGGGQAADPRVSRSATRPATDRWWVPAPEVEGDWRPDGTVRWTGIPLPRLEPAEDPSLLESSVAPTIGTLLSRITGLVRVVALAWALGQFTLTDQFNQANTAPNIIYELLLGGVLSATLVPLFTRAAAERDEETPNVILTTGIVALAVLSVGAVLAAPIIHQAFVFLLPAGRRSADAAVVVPLLRLLLPQIFLYGMATLCTSVLHSRRRYVEVAFTPVITNLLMTATFVLAHFAVDIPRLVASTAAAGATPLSADLLAQQSRLTWILGVGTTLAVAAMALPLIGAIQEEGLSFDWDFRPRHPAVAKLIRLSGWVLGYAAANQVALWMITSLARRGEGVYSAYQAAFIFFQLPHGLFAVSIMNAVVPVASSALQRRDFAELGRRFREGLSLLITLMIPAAVGLTLFARPLVDAALQRGLFDASAALRTAEALQGFALGLPGFSLYLFSLRLFYADEDTKTPFLINLGENALNIVAAVGLTALATRPAAQSLALAYSLAYTVSGAVTLWWVNRRFGNILGTHRRRTLGPGLLSGAGAAAVAVAVYLILGPTLAGLGVGAILATGALVGLVLLNDVPGFELVTARWKKG